MTVSELKYIKDWDGVKLYATGNNSLWTYDFNTMNRGDVWFYASKGEWVILTGYAWISNNSNDFYMLTTSGITVVVNMTNENTVKQNWTPEPTGLKTQQFTALNTQELVNGIIKNNKRIFENNLLCARFARKLTSSQQNDILLLQQRLKERNAELSNPNFIQSNNSAEIIGYNQLTPYLEAFMNNNGYKESVGGLILTIVITATVIAGIIGGAGYYIYKRLYDQSAEDVKYSNELTKILTEKLTESEFEMLKQETQGIVTKAVLKERLKSTSNKLLIYASVALAALVIIKLM